MAIELLHRLTSGSCVAVLPSMADMNPNAYDARSYDTAMEKL